MKRLFKVAGEFYPNKVAAKAARGQGTPVKDDQGKTTHIEYKHKVELGPDHDNYRHAVLTPGHQKTPQTTKKKPTKA